MVSCVESFLVYHASVVGRNALPGHFNFKQDELVPNFLGGNFIHENEIMQKLIMLFSQERDWILDVNSAEGKRILYGVVKTRVKILIPVSYFW